MGAEQNLAIIGLGYVGLRLAPAFGKLYSTVGFDIDENRPVAESAKAIENNQGDLNIVLVNELAMLFDRMQLDTKEVLDAAATIWNFLNFRPG